MNQPQFETLPDAGNGYRLVDGRPMTREEYITCGYHVTAEYTTDDGRKISYWSATLPGLQRYSQLKAQRRPGTEDGVADEGR